MVEGLGFGPQELLRRAKRPWLEAHWRALRLRTDKSSLAQLGMATPFALKGSYVRLIDFGEVSLEHLLLSWYPPQGSPTRMWPLDRILPGQLIRNGSQNQNKKNTEMCSSSEEGSYSERIVLCINKPYA